MVLGARVTEPRHLAKAPIKEAAIDIRVTGDIDIQELDFNICGFVKGSQIQDMELRLELHGPTLQHKESHEHIGYRHEAGDGKDIAQITTKGLTFSRLTPYKDWRTFSSLARAVWRQYIEAVGPVTVERLGVRYVNRLNVPMAQDFSPDDYFTNAPRLFMASRREMDHFLTRLVLRLSDPQEANAIVIQTIDKPSDGLLPLILDIDVFATLDEPDVDIWLLLDILRDYKNDIFFNTMTSKSLDLCG